MPSFIDTLALVFANSNLPILCGNLINYLIKNYCTNYLLIFLIIK
nr:MAG TPA: hypothetical protein [Crassvirales sp.]